MPAVSELEKLPEKERFFEEADKLLRFAEDLEEKCEAREFKERLTAFYGFVAAGVLSALGLWLLLSSTVSEPWARYVVIFGIIAPAAGIVGCVLGMYMAFQRQIRRDRRAIYAIVDMLRETEKAIADRHNLSALERLEFQIRLSRFDIGPGTYARS